MVDRTEERLGLKPQRRAADSAYGSAPTLNWIVNEKKIAPHIPVIDRSMREDGTFSRADLDSRRAQKRTWAAYPHQLSPSVFHMPFAVATTRSPTLSSALMNTSARVFRTTLQ
jgi:hypothetical protein